MHAALKKLEHPEPQATRSSDRRLVYVICDARDRRATIPVRKLLKARSLDAETPLFEGEAAAVRQTHQDLLAQCDAVLMFYGAGDESWFRTVDKDLKKAAAWRGGKALPVFTFLSEPLTDHKQELIDFEDPNVINALLGFAEPQLEPLLGTIGGGAK